ncbi:hypothetical protein [Streptomyces avicenniae]|uniref:hypothetical protein n=1 Tax=Streptomyces avicenniae TaxID=500153 RepID=UPI000699771E|nr:hypothetical protein [Streptomyces avicenniae]
MTSNDIRFDCQHRGDGGPLVIWDSFEQPHRQTRDYSGFGPFHFDRYQYDDAVNALSAAVSSEMM